MAPETATFHADDRSLDLAVACEIARSAGAELIRHFNAGDASAREKGYLDVVTVADTEAEQLIARALREKFPDDGIIGEEGTDSNPGSGRQWYVDPLDGTFNFARGIPFWCTSIGLVEEAEQVLGVVYDPLRDELFTVVKGAGSFLNGARIHVRATTEPMEATVQLSINFDRELIDFCIADFNATAKKVMRTRNLGALALELCYVACGRLDAVVQRGSHPWDYAAGSLIAQEAGAVLSKLKGADFHLGSDNALVAATQPLHAALCAMLNT